MEPEILHIALPLQERYVCTLCHPVHVNLARKTKGLLNNHNALKNHLKKTHEKDVQLVFICGCGQNFSSLKSGNLHVNGCRNRMLEEPEHIAEAAVAPTNPSVTTPRRTRSLPSQLDAACPRQRPVSDAATQTSNPPAPRRTRNITGAAENPADISLWQDRFNEVTCLRELEATLAAFTATITNTRPPRPPEAHGRILGRSSPAEEKKQLQRLYRSDPKKAMDAVRKGATTQCRIPKATLQEHFTKVYAASPRTTSAMPECVPTLPAPSTSNPFATPLMASLVTSRLVAASNTAPGPDRIRYNEWKKADPNCAVITTIFNTVLRLRRIPASWKTSTTTLLHKKDSMANVNNWRPIALANTLGKLFSSCVSWRLTDWCLTNHRLTSAQKGFMKFEGCLEHNFVLQSVIHDARQRNQTAVVAWLDFRNAFPSVPHTTITDALTWTGLDEEAIDLIKNLYDGCTTRIRTQDGMTSAIPINSGVRQGCPLSPIIFNIVMEPMIRAMVNAKEGYMLNGESIDVLAYADDVALTSRSPSGLQRQLDIATTVANWAGLQFNAGKCASLHVKGNECPPTVFYIQGDQMAASDKTDLYRHLGMPTGFKYGTSGEEILENMRKDVENIHSSHLAPWQKLDAVRMFVIPQITFHLKGGWVLRASLDQLDNFIRNCAKEWLKLPQQASTETLFLPHNVGGLNLMPLKMLADICDVVQAVHLLQSKDPQVVAVAKSTLQRDVKQHIKQPPTTELIQEYLNASTEGLFAPPFVSRSSIWTRLRLATRNLRKRMPMEWKCDNDGISLQMDKKPVAAMDAEKLLKAAFRCHLAKKLAAKPSQGKVFKVASLSSASNHFTYRGDYTTFAAWNFIHKARHNVVALNGCFMFPVPTQSCRKCGYIKETLPHVLNRCNIHMTAATKRHNAVVNRLEKVLPRNSHTRILANQTVPGCDSNLRPDITIIDDKNRIATIIDVAIPFESSYSAFEDTRRRKKEKYAVIERILKEKGYKTFNDAFIVGSLGSFDPANEACIRRLRITPRYATLMKKLMVSDVIKWSRDIYVEHVTGIRQYAE